MSAPKQRDNVIGVNSQADKHQGQWIKHHNNKAEDMTAPENFSSISNIPLIAERRPDMTMPASHKEKAAPRSGLFSFLFGW
jgi:hypothetical protein